MGIFREEGAFSLRPEGAGGSSSVPSQAVFTGSMLRDEQAVFRGDGDSAFVEQFLVQGAQRQVVGSVRFILYRFFEHLLMDA
ncbi:MAG: hypothetical protein JXA25_03020 [Anaerolineales bacterium]|nr:hypothetical protein [Anaerolineales bacterium]